jgi:hypothetical protein
MNVRSLVIGRTTSASYEQSLLFGLFSSVEAKIFSKAAKKTFASPEDDSNS